MKIISGETIAPRVLIKKIEKDTKRKSGIYIPPDNDALPQAEVIMVSKKVQDIVSPGDKVYYVETREKGRVKYKGEDHFIIPIGNIVAII